MAFARFCQFFFSFLLCFFCFFLFSFFYRNQTIEARRRNLSSRSPYTRITREFHFANHRFTMPRSRGNPLASGTSLECSHGRTRCFILCQRWFNDRRSRDTHRATRKEKKRNGGNRKHEFPSARWLEVDLTGTHLSTTPHT